MKLARLLVLIDPNQPQQPALQRAQWLAARTGAELHLLQLVFSSALDNNLFVDAPRLQAARQRFIDEQQAWLEGLAAPLREAGLSVTCHSRWSRQRQAEIIACATQLQVDLVLKSSHRHGLLKRLLLSNSDWELLRHCPLPLWLVHHGEWQGRRLCAALDPLHSADKPAALDHRLIEVASSLSAQLGLDAHYLHSFAPLPRSLVFDLEMVTDYQQYSANCARRHREAFEQLLAAHAIDLQRSHLLEGFAEQSIPAFVREQAIDLLVMGAVSRSQLDSAIIGNTAERVLEDVECDLLVLKPSAPDGTRA